MNRYSIDLNNKAVDYVQQGNIFKAFEFLSQAADLVSQMPDEYDGEPIHLPFRYQWIECGALFQRGLPCKLKGVITVHNEGCLPYMFTRFLRIYTDAAATDDLLIQHGYAWVIWFNLGIVCNIYGSCLGERGYQLSQRSDQLFQQVQLRIDDEPPSKQWSILQLAILNHRACIAYDYRDDETMMFHLDYTIETIASAPYLDEKDWIIFTHTMEILSRTPTAAAA